MNNTKTAIAVQGSQDLQAPPSVQIVVITAWREPLKRIMKYKQSEVAREGFPHMSQVEFMTMFCRDMHCEPTRKVTRIEFDYL